MKSSCSEPIVRGIICDVEEAEGLLIFKVGMGVLKDHFFYYRLGKR